MVCDDIWSKPCSMFFRFLRVIMFFCRMIIKYILGMFTDIKEYIFFINSFFFQITKIERLISTEMTHFFFPAICVANQKDSQINLSLLSKRFVFKICILFPQIFWMHNSFQNSTFWIVLNQDRIFSQLDRIVREWV